MSNPPAKRKVMGRIDLTTEAPGSSGRHTIGRSNPTSAAVREPVTPSIVRANSAKAGGRAKVDMSSMTGLPAFSPASTNSATPRATFTSPNGAESPSSSTATPAPHTPRAFGHTHSPSLHAPRSSPFDNGEIPPNVSVRAGTRAKARNQSVDLSGSSSTSTASTSSAAQTRDASSHGGPAKASTPMFSKHSRSAATSSAATPPSLTPTPVNRQAFIDRSRIRPGGIPVHRSRTPSPVSGASAALTRASEGWSSINPGLKSPHSLAPPYETPNGSPNQAFLNGLPRSPRSPDLPSLAAHDRLSPAVPSPSAERDMRRTGSYGDDSRRASSGDAVPATGSTNGPAFPLRPGLGGSGHARSNSALSRPPVFGPGASSRGEATSEPMNPAHSAPPLVGLSPAPGWPDMSAAMSPGSSEATPAFVAPPLLSPTSEYANLSPSEAAEAAEAKKDRKILDLEITNKSLLAINASLEVTKVKQTAEIRDLRRRIREGRMSLAPGPLGSALGLAPAQGGEEEEGEWFEDAEEGAEEDPELEAAHVRCKALIDRMVANARAAILSKYEPPKEGNKVLHPAEIAQLEEERRAKRLAEREAKGAGIDITSDARDRVGSEGPGTADTSFSVFSEMTDGADADADLSASGTGLGSQFSERSGTETEGDYSLRSVNYAEGEPDESVDDAPGLSARRAQISSVPDAGLLSPNSLRRPSPCSPKVPAYLDPGNDESSRISS